MKIPNWLIVIAWFWVSALSVQAADTYPSRPIRLVVPSGAGGITDILARVIAQKLGERFAQSVFVENRAGASGIVGSQTIANAAPDGYNLLMVFPSHVVNPSLYPGMPFDTVKAFAPITLVSTVSSVLVVGTGTPARTVQELITFAKANPGKLNYGDVGSGALNSLSAELFASMAGAKLTQVSYKGVPQILTALLSGEIHMTWIATAGTVVTQEKAGRLRPLGVTSRTRLPALPHVPPIADALPGYEALGWNGILAPAGTPQTVIDRLHQEIVQVVRSAEFAQHLVAEGATAVGNTPAEFDAIIRADIQKWATVLKESAREK